MRKAYNPLKIYKLGDPELSARTDLVSKTSEIQDYVALRKEFAGKGWRDPEFPPDESSLGSVVLDSAAGVTTFEYELVWLRVKDVVTSPNKYPKKDGKGNFYTDLIPKFSCGDYGKSFSRFDIVQGCIGDCYFVASLAALTLNKEAFEWVVPLDNEENDEDSGVYHFRLWYQGCWVDVVVDDYLPFAKMSENHYASYATAMDVDVEGNQVEFWVPLAEKAYAKLMGSYYTIGRGAQAMDAAQNITGGFCERYELYLDQYPDNFFDKLENNLSKKCIVTLCTAPTPKKTMEQLNEYGLVAPHVYCITKVSKVTLNNGEIVELIRIRNPHGTNEWTGKWSDTLNQNERCHESWDEVSEDQKKNLELLIKDDGEFWIELTDMIDFFAEMDVVSLVSPSLTEKNVEFVSYDEVSGEEGEDFSLELVAAKDGPGKIAVLFAEANIKSKILDPTICAIDLNLFKEDKDSEFIEPVEGTRIQASGGDTGGCHSLCLGYEVAPGKYRVHIKLGKTGQKYCARFLHSKK